MPDRDEKRYKLVKLSGGEVLSTQYLPTFREVEKEVRKAKKEDPTFIIRNDIDIYDNRSNKEWMVDLDWQLVEM